ncbi:MAG: hypothetical protein U0R52_06810 [Solirubrobacterales bacterium]
MRFKTLVITAGLALALVAAPTAAASKKKGFHGHRSAGFGATSLVVDPGTLDAFGSLGVSPGAVSPGRLDGATYRFPITNPLGNAIRTGVVRHAGGISLSAGATTVKLTDFDIKLRDRLLYGKVNGAGPVALLDLDYSGAGLRPRWGGIAVGPVGTTLTAGAADALNAAFGVSAFSDDTVIGKATISYRIFPF